MADYIRKDTARRIIDSPRNREQMLAVLESTPSEDAYPKDDITKAFSDGFEAGYKRGYERGKEDGK